MSSLNKALAIIAQFSAERPVISVSEVANELQIPKSSVSRLMKTMAGSGLIEAQAGGRGYVTGPFAFRLGNLYQARLRIMDLVDAAIGELVARFGLTGYAGVLTGADVVLLSVRQGHFPIRMVLEPGTRIPAHVSAIGQALLSRRSDAEIEALYPAPFRYKETDNSYTPSDIVTRAREVRALGYSSVEGMTFRGFNAVGAAIESAKENLCVGFSLSYPKELLAQFELNEIIAAITAEAMRIGEKTGDVYWADRSAAPSETSTKEVRPPVVQGRSDKTATTVQTTKPG
jgi:DNA-binding IclR family transcriptional regulator